MLPFLGQRVLEYSSPPARATSMRDSCHYYLLPIGGMATAALAGLLSESSFRVCGVDSALYPPASELLAELAVPVRLGFDPAHIPQVEKAVVIGNAVPISNPEVQAVLNRGLPYTSQAALFGELFCQNRKTVVVAGTHGKTTTTALVAHVLTHAGLDPTAFIGGVPRGGKPWRLGRSPWTVVEGDEYNTAFFDKGPKFLHYFPHIFVVNNVEFDHADLYPSLDAILAAFRAGVARVTGDGWVVANADDPGAREVAAHARKVLWYGQSAQAQVRCRHFSHRQGNLVAEVALDGDVWELEVPLVGRHNLANLLAVAAVSRLAGIPPETLQKALATFPGVRRRLEVVGEAGGVTVVDDFAHHPTAVGLTLEGARERFPGRRLVVAFEPRSLTAGRAELFPLYEQAFALADGVVLAPIFHRHRLPPEEQMDRHRLAAQLKAKGVDAVVVEDGGDPLPTVLALLRPGDVFIAMSSGDFGGLPRRVLAALGA
ncbi:UDP-N-acetylmuramate--L-alanyl-gamma-D-glutamyl-meso-2,6-diaminoheptandioate ligase [bacterium HR09]|nr:UDP-N-acetylmuramate--L-alanyl-gamma-D-glutamyl-meso-2,6-diaminoheptandioate ligase [bacterium HR09]